MNNNIEIRPRLSVIVCTYNRDKYIERNLKSFLHQTACNNDFEIVLVNNNCTDSTDEICTAFIKQNPNLSINYVIETKQGLSNARNKGIEESSAPIVAFIDDDAFVHLNYCENAMAFFESNPNTDIIGGKILPLYESGAEPKWMTSYLETLMAAQNFGDQIKPFEKSKFPIGANMLFRKSVFNSVGTFNPDLGRTGTKLEGGEEKDLIHRYREQLNSNSIMYVPNITVDHIIGEHRETDAYIKRMGIGIGKSELVRVKQLRFGILNKTLEEAFKWGATLVLLLKFVVLGQPGKGYMLLKFRYWVLLGLINNEQA